MKFIKLIPAVLRYTHEELDKSQENAVNAGYEGTVIKNPTALYQHNVRSSDMFKYKKTLSAEFLISDYNLDKNGLPVFVMKCDAGEFKAKPIGTKEYWAKFNPDEYVGKYATIEYETFSKDNIPLKPIFISLREVDSTGEAKE